MPARRNDLLLVEEIAEECRVPPSTVRHWLRTSRMPSGKLGRRRVVRREDFERFLRQAGIPEPETPGPDGGGAK